MPVSKQRPMRKAAAASGAPSSISNFTRVSKTVSNANVKKQQLSPPTPKKDVKLEAITPTSRKRKVVASIEDNSSTDERPKKLATPPAKKTRSSTASTTTTQAQPAKRGRGRPPKKQQSEPTPRKRVRSPSVSDSEASSIDTGALFKRLRLASSPSRFSSPLTADTSVAGSDIEPDINPTKPGELPNEVLSLVELHHAFLKTLTLHYAHNGSNVPADLRVLCPNIGRAWGKKKVTDANIRICLGVLGESSGSPTSSPFHLSNYGRGKICIEMNTPGTFGPLNENKLNALFRANLNLLWAKFLENESSEVSSDVAMFLASLPKAPVTLSASVAKASPLLLKGQQRLEDLKHGIAIKKQEKIEKQVKQEKVESPNPSAAPATKMSLLDRIRLKSLQKSAMPAGLTPAQLERRAALQRAEEVSALIAMLSRASNDGGDRVSFTMAVLLEKLKDSFRMGISKPEGAACIRLLATEVAPQWIRVVTLAGRENVVVDIACEISKPEVARRVQNILGESS